MFIELFQEIFPFKYNSEIALGYLKLSKVQCNDFICISIDISPSIVQINQNQNFASL